MQGRLWLSDARSHKLSHPPPFLPLCPFPGHLLYLVSSVSLVPRGAQQNVAFPHCADFHFLFRPGRVLRLLCPLCRPSERGSREDDGRGRRVLVACAVPRAGVCLFKMCLLERASTSGGERRRQREKRTPCRAGSPTTCGSTLGSRPEPKAGAQPAEPPRRPAWQRPRSLTELSSLVPGESSELTHLALV